MNGRSYTASFAVKIDPRVKASPADLERFLGRFLACRKTPEQGAASEHDVLFQPKLVDVDVDRGRF